MLTSASKVLTGFCMCLLIALSVTGNTLVCLAIYKDSRLRRTENLLIISLAVSDLLVAALVMTFAGVNDLLGHWVFGQSLCNAWICVDIMCSTASILNLCTISLDRYLHIKDPFQYPVLVTKRAVATSIAAVWALSAAISVFPVVFKNPEDGESSSCVMDLSPLYAVVSSTLSFCLPCLVMVAIYSQLYLTSRRHYRTITRLGPPGDHKAPLTIGVLLGVFLVCWLPFFCVNVLRAFCRTCVSDGTFKTLTWLGYSNSMFNPVVYTVLNSEFRGSFRLLLLKKMCSSWEAGNLNSQIVDSSLCTRAMMGGETNNSVIAD